MTRAFALACCAVAVAASTPSVARPGPPGTPPSIDRLDPARYDYDEAVVERALITARDGVTTLALDVIRPPTDERVPTILLQSPYYNTLCRGWRAECKTPWSGATFSADGRRTPFPEWYDEYFVPRGYAVVLQDQRGTRNSSGCQVYGGREEITDAVDVIEWIAAQPWSNRSVGMTGGSYDGTIAVGAASMAPPALKAIIPIRAIDRWYDYHFFNGAQSGQHLATPASFTVVRPLEDHQSSAEEDLLFGPHVAERKACAATVGAAVAARYSLPYQDATDPFWAARDFLADASRFRAATFIVHGVRDWNVKTTNAGHLWEALPEGLAKKLWWFRGGHADPARPTPDPDPGHDLPFPFAGRFVEATHRWFAEFLKGIDTGIRDEPQVSVQDEAGAWTDGAAWPPRATVDRVLELGPGTLGARAGAVDAYVHAGAGPIRDALVMATAPLRAPVRIAGQAMLRLRYSLPAGGDTSFAAALWDRAPDGTATAIAVAYARAGHRFDIRPRGPSWPTTPVPHAPGVRAWIAFPFGYADQVVPAGHRLELRLATSDDAILGWGTGAEVRIVLGGQSVLILPDAPSRADEHALAHGAR